MKLNYILLYQQRTENSGVPEVIDIKGNVAQKQLVTLDKNKESRD